MGRYTEADIERAKRFKELIEGNPGFGDVSIHIPHKKGDAGAIVSGQSIGKFLFFSDGGCFVRPSVYRANAEGHGDEEGFISYLWARTLLSAVCQVMDEIPPSRETRPAPIRWERDYGKFMADCFRRACEELADNDGDPGSNWKIYDNTIRWAVEHATS